MRTILIRVVVVILAAMSFGQPCPPQVYQDASTAPFAVDPNQCGVDPNGQPDLLCVYTVDVGKPVTHDGWICDDDGDAMSMEWSGGGTLTMLTATSYVYRYTPTSVGVTYHHLSVTDTPLPHQEPLTTTGTIAIAATRANKPPVIGCGSRPQ